MSERFVGNPADLRYVSDATDGGDASLSDAALAAVAEILASEAGPDGKPSRNARKMAARILKAFRAGELDDLTSGVEESLRESHEAVGEDGEPLARFYAELCDALDRAGATTEAQTIADEANEELAGSGWQVTRGESGWAATAGVEESLREAREGRTVGVPFQGASGRWFVVRQGNDGRKRVVPWADHDAQPRAAKARVAARAEKGGVDRQALLARLAKHVEGQEPNAAQQAWAKSAARMFQRHHGENALHRIEDLADTIEGALAKIQGDGLREAGARRDLQGKLRQLHLAMGAMGEKAEPYPLPPGFEIREMPAGSDNKLGLFRGTEKHPVVTGDSREEIDRFAGRIEGANGATGYDALAVAGQKRQKVKPSGETFVLGGKRRTRQEVIDAQKEFFASGRKGRSGVPSLGENLRRVVQVAGAKMGSSGNPSMEGTLSREDDGLHVVTVASIDGGVKGVKVGDKLPYTPEWGRTDYDPNEDHDAQQQKAKIDQAADSWPPLSGMLKKDFVALVGRVESGALGGEMLYAHPAVQEKLAQYFGVEEFDYTDRDELGFTGFDPLGREWRDGALVPAKDEAKANAPAAPAAPAMKPIDAGEFGAEIQQQASANRDRIIQSIRDYIATPRGARHAEKAEQAIAAAGDITDPNFWFFKAKTWDGLAAINQMPKPSKDEPKAETPAKSDISSTTLDSSKPAGDNTPVAQKPAGGTTMTQTKDLSSHPAFESRPKPVALAEGDKYPYQTEYKWEVREKAAKFFRDDPASVISSLASIRRDIQMMRDDDAREMVLALNPQADDSARRWPQDALIKLAKLRVGPIVEDRLRAKWASADAKQFRDAGIARSSLPRKLPEGGVVRSVDLDTRSGTAGGPKVYTPGEKIVGADGSEHVVVFGGGRVRLRDPELGTIGWVQRVYTRPATGEDNSRWQREKRAEEIRYKLSGGPNEIYPPEDEAATLRAELAKLEGGKS